MHLHTGEAGGFHGRCADRKAPHNLLDLSNRQRHGLTELSTGQSELYRGRRLRMWIDIFLGLPPRVADLRPEMIAVAGGRSCPARQCLPHGRVRFAINDHIARALKVIAINQDVA